MNLAEIKDWIWIVITLGSLLVTAIGYTYTVRNQIKRNRELREIDKSEILQEIARLNKRVDKVEVENSHTHSILTEIKVQIASLETTIKLYFDNK